MQKKPEWEPAAGEWIVCPICGGSGKVYYPFPGVGEKECGHCDGTGWINV